MCRETNATRVHLNYMHSAKLLTSVMQCVLIWTNFVGKYMIGIHCRWQICRYI